VGTDTIIFPGFDGGAEWGGSAEDPATGILYVNANEMAWTGALAENTGNESSGRGIYQTQCSVCHRDDMAGSPPQFPALTGIANRMGPKEITATITQGKGRMPAFTSLTQDQLFAVIEYVMSGESKELQSSAATPAEMKYRFTGYKKFLDPEGYPAIAPPWGTLNAINLNTGEYAWKIPLGEYPELAAQGMKNTGSENYGGPIVTAGGLLFIGASNFDRKFRAFDKSTGELLWETTLPFSGNGTPATYEVDGRQYVVIAAGGGKDPRQGSGGVYVAFALPRATLQIMGAGRKR
jgi:quinoprotein glucose dehydrogenase